MTIFPRGAEWRKWDLHVHTNQDLRLIHSNACREIFDQVKDVKQLYDYLFGLEFLTSNYQLKQGGKEIEQL